MNDPELYHIGNSLQIRDARQCLEEYAREIKWKKYGDTVIDIGCGDGTVTSCVLKNFIPNNCKELVGCDISESMVQFANAHHAKDFISFTVLDIEGDLPELLREQFNHAFSFYVLNWITHQEIAFSNIYNLLVRGGDCLLMFMGHMPMYEVWRKLACTPRWNHFLKDVNRFVSPYHDCQDPEKDIKIMMTTIGFTNVEVKYLQKVFVYTGVDEFKNAMKGVNPFNIPLEMREDFLDDHVRVVYEMKLVDHTDNNTDEIFKLTMNYKHIIAHGKKIAFSNIYNLWVRGGDCLLMFMGRTPVYEIWRELARASRWNRLLKDVNGFVSPYQDYEILIFLDPKKYIEIMMTTVGFTNVEIIYLQKEFVYTGVEHFRNAMNGVNPFKISLEIQNDFIDDHVRVVRDLKLVNYTDNDADDTFKVKLNYKLIIAYGKK